jgi:hypothetical protein
MNIEAKHAGPVDIDINSLFTMAMSLFVSASLSAWQPPCEEGLGA